MTGVNELVLSPGIIGSRGFCFPASILIGIPSVHTASRSNPSSVKNFWGIVNWRLDVMVTFFCSGAIATAGIINLKNNINNRPYQTPQTIPQGLLFVVLGWITCKLTCKFACNTDAYIVLYKWFWILYLYGRNVSYAKYNAYF